MKRLKFVGVLTLCLSLWGSSVELRAAEEKTASAPPQSQRYKNLELFQKVLHFIESNYVDEVKNDELIHGAIQGMMDTLDPHSNFLPPEVFRDMKVDTSGEFAGVGIEIGIRDSVLTIVAPIDDTPAWEAGLKPNDRIIKINGISTKGMSLAEAVTKMRGSSGSSITLSIYRKGFSAVKDVKIQRKVIKIAAVKKATLPDGFGYIRLKTFNENASRDMERAIKWLKNKKHLNGLVFDMRRTPGGLLDQAVEVSSLFLDGGIVVSTIGRDRNKKEVKHARKGRAYKDFPVAILVDSSTASAAEIVAGALQDHRRAVVMGERTFGKGSVQTVVDLGRNKGLKLTIARYYTPNGQSIQSKGVVPDIELDNYDPDLLQKAKIAKESIRESDLEGHLIGDDEDEYSQAELNALVGEQMDKKKKSDAEQMKPIQSNPRKDYQVLAALKYLKSFDVFQKLSLQDKKDSAKQ